MGKFKRMFSKIISIMKITLEPTENQKEDKYPHSKIMIEHPCDDLTLDEVMDSLIKPALIAYSYSEETVDKFLNKGLLQNLNLC